MAIVLQSLTRCLVVVSPSCCIASASHERLFRDLHLSLRWLLYSLFEGLKISCLVGVLEENEALIWFLGAALTEIVSFLNLSRFLSHLSGARVALIQLIDLTVHVLLKHDFAKGTLPDSKWGFSNP